MLGAALALAFLAGAAQAGTNSDAADAADEALVAQVQASLGLPRPLGLAASWDPELLRASYAALGAQLAQTHKTAALTPNLDVLRDSRRGDASSTFGEDPFLTGELGAAAVTGLQSAGVRSVVGHFAGPQLPPPGADLGPMPVSPRELREVFVFPFETVIRRAQPAGVLLSDNEIDGIPSLSNPALVRMLKEELHFKGAVLSKAGGALGALDVATTVAPAAQPERAAAEGVVLLKNEGALPWVEGVSMNIAVIKDASPEALAPLALPPQPYVLVLSGKWPTPSLALTALVEGAKAVLAGFELGAQGDKALDDALHGRLNPGGKLPLSLARNAGQLPMFYNVKPTAWRGYLFDTTKPLYAFGWGLSYTQFEVGAPKLGGRSIKIGQPVSVKITVRNTGSRAGDEVVQLYLHHKTSSTTEPVKQLVGFARVSLKPQESRTLELSVSPEQLSIWNLDMQRVQEPGEIELMSGSNSVDLKSATLLVVKP
jgi:hypothetical protein